LVGFVRIFYINFVVVNKQKDLKSIDCSICEEIKMSKKSKETLNFIKEKIFKEFLLKQYKGANLSININTPNKTGGIKITTPSAGDLEIILGESPINTGKQTLNYQIKEIHYNIQKDVNFNFTYKKS